MSGALQKETALRTASFLFIHTLHHSTIKSTRDEKVDFIFSKVLRLIPTFSLWFQEQIST